jgi:hypothetical protein
MCFHFLPNVQDEPRPWLARLVLLGARGVTAMVVGSGVLFGFFFIRTAYFVSLQSGASFRKTTDVLPA